MRRPASWSQNLDLKSQGVGAALRDGTLQWRPRRSDTVQRTLPSRRRRDSLHRSNPESCPRSNGPHRTTLRSSRSARCPSLLRLLNGEPHNSNLVVLRIVTQRPGDRHRLGGLGVDEVSRAALFSPIREAGSLQIGYELSYLRRHPTYRSCRSHNAQAFVRGAPRTADKTSWTKPLGPMAYGDSIVGEARGAGPRGRGRAVCRAPAPSVGAEDRAGAGRGGHGE